MAELLETKWHTLSIAETFKILESGEHGLSNNEAMRRLAKDGLNKLPETKPDSIALIFLRQFQSPLIYILMAAAIAVFAMGENVDGIIILFVLVFNAIIGSIQEGRAQDTLQALKKFTETTAAVIREEKEIVIPDSEVVTGDIIVLREGEKVPADARLMDTHNLKVDEAALTGESEAVRKQSDILANPKLPTLEQENMVFKGTHIVSGNSRAIVIATGTDTFIGRIATQIAEIDTEIPLKANIRHLSRLIIAATAVITISLFVIGITYGNSASEMFATTISLAVSVIPSGLPIALTIILAAGVWRMSKRNALVKRLQAVEALGQASIIAVDKTGTITKNEMSVQEIYVDNKTFEVGGVGYEPKGEIRLDEEAVNPPNHPELLLVGKMMAFCANASTLFQEDSKEWRVIGDPTEAALFVLAQKLGFNKSDLEHESRQVGEIPFDYKIKYHGTIHKESQGNFLTIVGAPEVVLEHSDAIWHHGDKRDLTDQDKISMESVVNLMSRKGLRVLAMAKKENVPEEVKPQNVEHLTFVGLVGMKDALRPEVKEATRRAQEAGIRVVMITGDHKVTARAIATEALIYKPGDRSLSGVEIDKMSDRTLSEALSNTSIFARVTPEHKFRIINIYKKSGEIVAMTGDGVNDAPSLVAADLGVAMGKIGTEVAKEASDIILLDDNFGSIVSAVEEGRSIYNTIKKVVLYLISTSIGEVLVIVIAILLGFPLPLLAAQIIWLNFVTDGFFIPALAMEPREDGLLRRRFKKPGKYLMDKLSVGRMFLMATAMTIPTLLLFAAYYENDLTKAWTISLTILAVFQWFNAWNCRSEKESVFRMNPFSNKYLIIGTLVAFAFQMSAVYHPFFQKFLRTTALDLNEWLVIISFAASIIVVEEIRKFIWRNKKSWSSSAPQLQASLA